MGPTASGKTDLAIQLADEISGEIISVDSALIYKQMDIGTAKPTAEELSSAPHALISFLDPANAYSVADFRKDALEEIARILQKGKTPICVGGTMMYFKALLEGISPLPEADPKIREQISNEANEQGWEYIHQQLNEVDPVSAARIHPNDPQRLNRALEVYRITGKSLTELSENKGEAFPYPVKQFAIAPKKREILHDRIELRFKQMIAQGFEQEVRALYKREDLHLNLPSMRCVGYRQMWEYFEGKWTHDEMIYRGVVATRQLAKRQMTWLNSWPNITWLETGNAANLQLVVASLS